MSHPERDRLNARYWTFWNGHLVPQWLKDLAGVDTFWIYADRIFYGRWPHFRNWGCLPCAIEVEHRKHPVSSPNDVRRLAARIRMTGHDFTPALELEQLVLEEEAQLKRESDQRFDEWKASLPQRYRDGLPDGVRLLQELERKQLPKGAAANLALIRKIVGADKSESNE